MKALRRAAVFIVIVCALSIAGVTGGAKATPEEPYYGRFVHGTEQSDHGGVTPDGLGVVLLPYGADWPGDRYGVLTVSSAAGTTSVAQPVVGVVYTASDGGLVIEWTIEKVSTPDTPEESTTTTAPSTTVPAETTTTVPEGSTTTGTPTTVPTTGTPTTVPTTTGDDSSITVSTVVAECTEKSPCLPAAGSDSTGTLVLVVILLLVGTALVLVRRRPATV